ncbi:R3H domain-containing protein 2 isoform X1 [Megalops cyprinoides]|uniref:R3H domain-containing protein 2 isoform X1 n=1 Tax=Megalops cyprinoides TaxID=118141 RepID=UPI0018651160|nr:R3H domain-containing protein 2 isoform X1 [Megalops cyprinoides]XP_036386314.1 R3H domain-containing protein 2 isoform X1 [Megalops cyprinoides]XP_036386315.1 R3H domain-containing protein 2 isoform X1 [Megalops cyprinoides]XP_036386316.1 R3H domain-containing protein 2 isoform X1 [Megalops cyprinoides]
MSINCAPDILKEGESGLLNESVGGRGKASQQPPSKEGTGEGMEGEETTTHDSQRRTQNHGHGRKRAKSNAKLKLVRSLAVCEESSGPFSSDGPTEPHTQDIIQLHISCPSDKEEEKSSKDEYENEEKEKNKDKTPRKMLSRDSSQEYTDSTGIDVHEFLVNTLKNNPRDRMMLLKLEQDILEFINDDNNQYKKFPQMTSYHRMLLHRVAAYFGMDHNVDQTGKAVIINKTGNTRIPEQRFSEHIKDERNMDFQKKFILKRDDASMDKDDNQIRVPLQDGRRSKSIEEREEEYQRVRDRIFARESSQNGYINDNRLSTDGYSSSSQKRRQIFRGNRESSSRASSSRQSSTDSEMKCLEPRPWSSTDSDSSNRTLRPPVTKASSFSGISILTRGDSLGSKGSQGSCRGSRSGLPVAVPDLCPQPPAPQPGRSLLPCPSNTQQPPQGQQPQPPPQTALLPTPPQHPMGNHMLGQPVASLQPSPQAVSYSSPSCPQVLLPVSPPQQYNMTDDLAPQFGQMTLSRQGSSEAPEPPSMYQPPPTVLSQHPPPQTGYIMAPGGQPMPPPSGYQPASGHPHPPPPPPPPSQPVMQPPPPPQGYMQPPPPQQIQVSYYPPGQYPSSGQQYRPMSHQVSYTAQRSQPLPQPAQQSAGLQTMMPSQQPAYQGMMGVQQPQNPGLLNSQRAGMGGQMQSMMVQYPPMPSYQVPVANESQQVVQQQFQQPVMVPASQSVQGGLAGGGMPVYYSVLTPTQQNSTSPSVGYLQPPSSEQYQMTQSPSPCNPQQMQQQYSAGVPPPGPGVMVMQLSVPNGPQPTQSPQLVQWNPCKYYSLEQRASKPGELYKPDASPQASNQLSSPLASPTQSPTPSPSGSVSSVCPGLGPLPLISHLRPGGPAQGDGRYSLLGQPLQYSLCPPPLMHSQSSYNSHQGQGGMKPGARGKRQTLKSASTDLGTTDVVVSRVLEVTDLPEGISRPEAEKLFNQLSLCGAKIQWLKDAQTGRGSAGSGPAAGMAGGGAKNDGSDPAHLYTVVAVFPSTMAAQSASFKLNNSGASLFKLRAAKKNYDLRILERASSQ